jgi:TolB-like protein
MLQLRLLGPFEFRRDDGSAAALPGRQSLALLAYLAVVEHSVETRERLAALIWAGRAEIVRSSADYFQIAHPGMVAETTGWLRALLHGPGIGGRPAARILPEIADHPSIAVLPFTDLTDSPGFPGHLLGDIITDEITTALARVPGLFVTARHSAMAYRNAAIDVRSIAAELGVRYLIEGSAVRSSRSVRCNVRLIAVAPSGTPSAAAIRAKTRRLSMSPEGRAGSA